MSRLTYLNVGENAAQFYIPSATTMKFLINGADNTALGTAAPGTQYNFIAATHQSSWNATETNRDCPVAANMTLKSMVVEISTAPGSGNTRVFTVMVDGVATAAVVTIPDDETVISAEFSVSVTAGQTISLRAEATGTPADTTNVYWSIVAESVGSAYFVVFGGSGTAASATVDNFQQLQNASGAWQTAAASAAEVMPLAGSITALYCNISDAPGSGGDAYTITVLVDEAASELAVTWTDAETGIKNDTGTVAITAGQTVAIKSSIAVSPTARQFAWSVKVIPTTSGQSCVMFGNPDTPSTSVAEFEQLFGGGNASWITTEANRYAKLYPATIQAIYAKVGTAPANGAGTQSWTFQVREDGVNLSGASVVISEAATTGNTTGLSIATLEGSLYNWSCTPANTPAAMTGGAHLGIQIIVS